MQRLGWHALKQRVGQREQPELPREVGPSREMPLESLTPPEPQEPLQVHPPPQQDDCPVNFLYIRQRVIPPVSVTIAKTMMFCHMTLFSLFSTRPHGPAPAQRELMKLKVDVK
jgi:hypothetical protein